MKIKLYVTYKDSLTKREVHKIQAALLSQLDSTSKALKKPTYTLSFSVTHPCRICRQPCKQIDHM